MNKNTVVSLQDREQISDPLTELVRAGARKLIEQAIDIELQELLSQYTGQQTDSGHAAVVRNGYLPERAIQTGIGPVTVKIPKVRSRSGAPVTFHSALVPPYIRKTRSLEAAIPWLYLKGVSSGEMGEALKILVGPRSRRVIGQHGFPSEAGMGAGIPGLAQQQGGPGSLGVPLGRRHIQRVKGRTGETVCAGHHGR